MIQKDTTDYVPQMVRETVIWLVRSSRRPDRLVSRNKLKKWGYIYCKYKKPGWRRT